jgi:predicted DNA-binding transcriptional regulator AlpA
MSLISSQGAISPRFDHVSAFDDLPETALISVHEITALACRSRASIWRDVKAGRLPKPIAIGPQARRWRVADVRAYLKGGAA